MKVSSHWSISLRSKQATSIMLLHARMHQGASGRGGGRVIVAYKLDKPWCIEANADPKHQL